KKFEVNSRRMPIDDATFKLAMSHFPSGVTVVTTEHDGKPYGLTVSAFASLSLHPPLVLVSIEKQVKSHDAIAAAGKFGVSILARNQAELSGRFASRIDDKLAGAITTLECRVHAQLPGGDHTIFVGEVAEAKTAEGDPLVYYRSAYRDLA